MRNMLITATALVLGAGSVLAEEGRRVTASPAMSSEIRAGLESTGYRVDRIEVEHGTFEVRAVNDSGFPIKATYDARGELIRAALR
ncbi:MAG TPA: PepSY domain-containing protein [Beijerinckiaceae bacterium]|jgi:hypothetical protein